MNETLFAEQEQTTKPKRGRPPKQQQQTLPAPAPTPQPLAAPRNTLELIANAAANPAVDVHKMKELLAMRNQEEARVAEIEFNEALKTAQTKMPRVIRDAKGAHGIPYARLETVSKQIDPIARECGFSLSYGMSDSPLEKHYRITAKLSHIAGHSREYFVDLPADLSGPKGKENKNPTQGVGSTISYGRRYLKLMIFDVAIANEDTDGADVDVTPIDEAQVEQIQKLIVEVGADIGRFCRHFKIEKINELRTSDFQRAMDALEAKRSS